MRLSHEQLKAFSQVALTLAGPTAFEDFPLHAIRALERLIPSDYCAFNEFEMQSDAPVPGRIIVHPFFRGQLAVFETYLQQHPLYAAVLIGRVRQAVKISDFASLSRWQSTDLYNNFYRSENQNHQLVFVCQYPQFKVGIAFNRSNADFTEEERQIADLISPHFAQAHRNSTIISALCQTPPSSNERLLVADKAGKIRFITQPAKESLETCAGPVRNGTLPDGIRDWLRRRSEQLGIPDRGPLNELRLRSGNGDLIVRALAANSSEETYLCLREDKLEQSGEDLQALGLTKREAEVLYWVSEGKRNSEIALILGIKARTITKHLERIFQKLSVETRSAAAGIALSCLNGPTKASSALSDRKPQLA